MSPEEKAQNSLGKTRHKKQKRTVKAPQRTNCNNPISEVSPRRSQRKSKKGNLSREENRATDDGAQREGVNRPVSKERYEEKKETKGAKRARRPTSR